MSETKNIHMKNQGLENHDLEIKILDTPIPLSSAKESQQKYISHVLNKSCDCIATLKTWNDKDNRPITQAYFSKGKFLFATIADPMELSYIDEKDQFIQSFPDFKRKIEKHFQIENIPATYNTFSQLIRDSRLPNKFKDSVKELYDNQFLRKY